MPNEGLSIYFTITDKASPTLASIGDKTKALDKETQALAQSYAALQKANEGLIKKQTELDLALKKARQETKEAKKAFLELGDAASQDAYEKAKRHQEELRTQLSQTSKALRENESIYKQNMETVRKSSIGGGIDVSSIAKGLATGQVGQMVATSLGEALNFSLSSGMGLPAAEMLSKTLSGAVSGVAAGAIAGLPGMIIGGLVGAGSGALSGYTKIQEAKDEAYKEYYATLYDDVNAATEEMISSGSTVAGGREQTRMAFIKRFEGDEAAADAYLARVKSMAASTNYGYDEITAYSKQLLNTYAPDEVFGVLQSLSDATAGLSLSSSDVNVMISGLARMRTTGKATQEYLNYFSERGVDVYSALGSALGVDKSKIAGMVTKGDITGEVAAQAILDYIDNTYGGLSEDLMGTYDAMSANLEDILSNLEAAGGEGYNEMRKAGLEAEMDAYSGALGEAVSAINRISGENQAYLENLSDQYQREALSAVLLGSGTSLFSDDDKAKLEDLRNQYLQAEADYLAGNQEAGLVMEALKETAEATATAAYESSDQYQTLVDTQLDQITAIRENTAGLAAATNAYLLSQEKSKGIASTEGYVSPLEIVMGARTKAEEETIAALAASEDWEALTTYMVHQAGGFMWPELFSGGKKSSQPSVQITVTGNQFAGTSEELPDQVASVILSKLMSGETIYVP